MYMSALFSYRHVYSAGQKKKSVPYKRAKGKGASRRRRRAPTSTSGFGVSRRESHDSSPFYARQLYSPANTTNNDIAYAGLISGSKEGEPIASGVLDKILCKSSEKMEELPDRSIHLVVTSPPYNVGKEYDGDLTTEQYREMLKNVFRELYRVLADGGRACINVANLGRKPYIPLHSYIIQDMLACGFSMRGEIIWYKDSSAGVSTAWGSWKSPSNPTLRDVHEYILVFSKGPFSRKAPSPLLGQAKSTISKTEFLEYTKSVWKFRAESAKKVGHPAPFPVELPYRCIQLYTFADDVVLDPFCGVGSTCIAALKTGRHFVGYDTKLEYVQAAQARIATLLQG
jgi:DNA modification methylase